MKNTKFSIIICTSNRAKRLEALLESLSDVLGRYKDFVEVLIVDNNSDDQTNSVCQKIIADANGLNIRYIFEKRQGLSYARNTGINHASGEVVIFIDDDVILNRTWLPGIIRGFSEYPEALGMGGRINPLFLSSLPKWLAKNQFWKQFRGVIISHDLGDSYRQYTIQEDLPFGANMAFRKEAFRKYGLFRKELGRSKRLMSYEDAEFCERLLARKEKIIYNPGMALEHAVEPYRLKLYYIVRWMFYAGISRATVNKTDTRAVLNIPSYEIKKFTQIFLCLSLSILKLRMQDYIAYSLRLVDYCGFFIKKLDLYFFKDGQD